MRYISYLALFALLAASLTAAAAAATPSGQLAILLSTYAPKITAPYNLTNTTSSGIPYTIVRYGPSSYLIVNTFNSPYSLVTSPSLAYNVLSPVLHSQNRIPLSVAHNLSAYMSSFQSQAAPALNDCLTETGLNIYNCTTSNRCFSCSVVPVCRKTMAATGGPFYPFALGIMNFSAQYRQLNEDYNTFFGIISNVNQSNASAVTAKLSSLTQNISQLAASMPDNPVFPIPHSVSGAQISSCVDYLAPAQPPYYCNSVGLCQYTSFNSTLLAREKAALASLQSLMLSDGQILTASNSAAAQAAAYIKAYGTALNSTQLTNLLSGITPQYEALVANVSSFTNQTGNAALAANLSSLTAAFKRINATGGDQNVTSAGVLLRGLMANLTSEYQKSNANVTAIRSESENNTLQLITLELDYRAVPAKLAGIASVQSLLNLKLVSRAVNTTSQNTMLAQLASIKANLSAFGPPLLSAGAISKALGGPIATPILAGLEMPVPSKIATAPTVVALIALVLGLVVIGVVYMLTYARYKRRKRLNPSARMMWTLSFIVLVVLVLALVYISYSDAASATSFIPLSSFTGSLRASKTVTIAMDVNVLSNSSLTGCAASLQAALTSENKVVTRLNLSNYTCTGNQYPSCYDNLLSSGKPVILFAGSPTVVYSGLYGTQLNAGGPLAAGSSCLLAQLLK